MCILERAEGQKWKVARKSVRERERERESRIKREEQLHFGDVD